jgi:hypothetical protein
LLLRAIADLDPNEGLVCLDSRDRSTITHEFDIIVLATGFDAFTGSLKALNIKGCGGRALNDKRPKTSAEIPTTCSGVIFRPSRPTSAWVQRRTRDHSDRARAGSPALMPGLGRRQQRESLHASLSP